MLRFECLEFFAESIDFGSVWFLVPNGVKVSFGGDAVEFLFGEVLLECFKLLLSGVQRIFGLLNFDFESFLDGLYSLTQD